MSRQLKLRSDSRYTITPLLQDVDDTFFGLWVAPEIPLSPFDSYHTVNETEIGRMDSIANKYYGNTELWWVIAQVNSINDSLGLVAGIVLRIPLKANVTAALSL